MPFAAVWIFACCVIRAALVIERCCYCAVSMDVMQGDADIIAAVTTNDGLEWFAFQRSDWNPTWRGSLVFPLWNFGKVGHFNFLLTLMVAVVYALQYGALI